MEGLRRLVANNYRFTVSKRAKQALLSAWRDANNISMFLNSKGYIAFQPEEQISSKELYRIYRQWCEDNVTPAQSARSLVSYLIENQGKYGLSYTNRISLPTGRLVRGFVGIAETC